ncbi:hypothetical protein SLEP1_g16277 [Rubroshorea leprosula]|uniref:Uncharacterized protein n=1 Tax=Rubroshorea leprosula TaxID=152421 RepID=A0AAV5IW62_9ROSI|nr:hypothetical protein SLEP1_g16277 [Rubroshorea leprosula]
MKNHGFSKRTQINSGRTQIWVLLFNRSRWREEEGKERKKKKSEALIGKPLDLEIKKPWEKGERERKEEEGRELHCCRHY